MKVIQRTLPNGLTVLLAPMAGAKSVTCAFVVRAGWKYETIENHGVAHFLEHMAYKGTEKRPTALSISKEIDGIGGDNNAYTSEEHTVFWVKVASRHTEVACDVLADIILNSTLDPDEIKKERGTIVQELKMYRDNPLRYVGMFLWPRLLYGNQPAGRVCVGTEESLQKMQRSHFVDFQEMLYRGENVAFCIAGKIPNVDKALFGIADFFAGLRSGGPQIAKPFVFDLQDEPAMLLEVRDTQQSNLILGARAYSLFDPRRYALGVLKVILGGNMSSRMFTEVREKRGLAYSVGCGVDKQTDVGNFFTWAGVDREKVCEAIRVIMDQYRLIACKEVSQEELERAKECIIGSGQLSLESSSNVANHLSQQWALKGEITPLSQQERAIRKVTAKDVLAVAQDIFRDEKLNLAMVGPLAGMEDEIRDLIRF